MEKQSSIEISKAGLKEKDALDRKNGDYRYVNFFKME